MLTFVTTSLLAMLATTVALADYPPPGTYIPCGTALQCSANETSCPASEGWIYLPPPKWVKCCLLTQNPGYYKWFWIKIHVFNKMPPGEDDRCYRRVAYVALESCHPTWGCIADSIPADPPPGP